MSAARIKTGVIEMSRNGLTLRVEVTARGAGRRSTWTAAQLNDKVLTLIANATAKFGDAGMWDQPQPPPTEPAP